MADSHNPSRVINVESNILNDINTGDDRVKIFSEDSLVTNVYNVTSDTNMSFVDNDVKKYDSRLGRVEVVVLVVIFCLALVGNIFVLVILFTG